MAEAKGFKDRLTGTTYDLKDSTAREGVTANAEAIAALAETVPAVDDDLETAGAAADAKKTGDELSNLKSQITGFETVFTASSVGTKKFTANIIKGVRYSYTNNTSASTSVNVYKADGTSTPIHGGLAAGATVSFVATDDYVQIGGYFNAAGTVTLVCFGVFPQLNDVIEQSNQNEQDIVKNSEVVDSNFAGASLSAVATAADQEKKIAFKTYKGAKVTFENTTSATVAVKYWDENDEHILLGTITAGNTYSYVLQSNASAIGVYFNAAGTVNITIDGVFSEISVIKSDTSDVANYCNLITDTLENEDETEEQATVTADSYKEYTCSIPVGCIVRFYNCPDSSNISVNVLDKDGNAQNFSTGLAKGDGIEFEAPFDIVKFRHYVGGTAFHVRVKYGYKSILTLQTEINNDPRPWFIGEVDDTVEKAISNSEEKAFVLALVTDTHTLYQNKDYWIDTVTNIGAVNRRYKVDCIMHLGDVVEGNKTPDDTKEILRETVDDLCKITPFNCVLTGNHDDNFSYYDNHSDGLITDAERYAILNRYNDTWVERIGTNQYYYFDIYNSNMPIRVICLDGLLGDGYPHGGGGTGWGYTTEQVEWVRDVALDTERQVVFLSHFPLSSIYLSSYSSGTRLTNEQELRDVISAFISNGGVVIGWFNGHTHADFIAVDSIGIHEVQTGTANMAQGGDWGDHSYNDGAYTPNVPVRAENKSTQDLWDVVIIKPITRKVKIIRFGAGNDREFTY